MANSMINTEPLKLTKDDFTSDQEPRWCPGCGDYSILAQMKKVLPELGIPKEKFVFVSGIGCSSRFPYYMDTYGFHGIHGRAAVLASGVKTANPDLKVFVITGDGDALSIGGNHFIHLCRRNIDITMVLFNNRIYGLTKGQYSPTSEKGKKTKSSPWGTLEAPFNPVQMAMASGASFVGRTIDRDPKHLADMLKRAAEHKGTAFIEVYQNCNIFNDGAFARYTEPETKGDHVLQMEEGQPFIFGKNKDKVLNWNGDHFEVSAFTAEKKPENPARHNPRSGNAAMEFLLSSLTYDDQFPTPFGVFRQLEQDTFEDLLVRQIEFVKQRKGPGDLNKLLQSGDSWMVE
jgi:2-oxoglutarate ferredoxin oxidoreductase subunit beta